jgi:hypothetical protein
MKFRNSAKLPKGQFVISEDLILWGAAAVMCYSIFVPLLALESLFLADTLLQFGMLHQTGMLILVVLARLERIKPGCNEQIDEVGAQHQWCTHFEEIGKAVLAWFDHQRDHRRCHRASKG